MRNKTKAPLNVKVSFTCHLNTEEADSADEVISALRLKHRIRITRSSWIYGMIANAIHNYKTKGKLQ